MNVLRLTEDQKRAIHTALCLGGGIGGAARAAGIDKRSLQRLVEGEEGDTFLLGLISPEAITREEYEGLTADYILTGERRSNVHIRERYADLLRDKYGERIRLRVLTEAEKEEERERVKEANRKLEAEARQQEARRRYEAERAEEEKRIALCEKLYGDSYEPLRPIRTAYQMLYGTEEEIQKGLGGAALEAERDAYRLENGLTVDHLAIHRSAYATHFVKRKKEQLAIVEEVERIVKRYGELKRR